MAVDLVVILLLAGGFLLGFFRGAIRQLTSIGAWLICFLLGAHLAPVVGRWLVGQAPTYSFQYGQLLSFGAIFIILLTAALILFQVVGTTMTLTRHELLDNVLGGLLGATLVLLIATSLVVILDSYYTLPVLPATAELPVLREAWLASESSAIANGLRASLIPLLGAVLGPILPSELRPALA